MMRAVQKRSHGEEEQAFTNGGEKVIKAPMSESDPPAPLPGSGKVFHCPSCGTISPVSSSGKACVSCGELLLAKAPPEEGRKEGLSGVKTIKEARAAEGKRRKRRKRSRKKKAGWGGPLLFLVFWGLLCAGLAVAAWKFLDSKRKVIDTRILQKESQRKVLTEAEKKKMDMARKKIAFGKRHLPALAKALSDFMDEETAAAKAQYVFRSRDLALEMSRYYRRELPLRYNDKGAAYLKFYNVLDRNEHRLIATYWRIGDSGLILETVFVQDGDEWKFDWKQLTRHSSQPWETFFSGLGEREGVFRVFLRKRLIEDERNIEVALYEPGRFIGEFEKTRRASLSVEKENAAGKALAVLFARTETRRKGEKIPEVFDPEGLARATVRLAWEEVGGEPALVLKEVLSGSWLDETLCEKDELQSKETKAPPAEGEEAEPEEKADGPAPAPEEGKEDAP